MITGGDIYEVIAAMLPMYVAILLGYGAVSWWRVFTPEQCIGVNRFITNFGLPMLVLKFMAKNNPYTMNLRFIAADTLQKVIILVGLLVWLWVCKRATLDWAITLFSLSTVPNTVIIGIPILKAMYGNMVISLLIQISVLQCLIWINLLMAMFEYRAATIIFSQTLPVDDFHEKKSFRMDSMNEFSLARSGPLDAKPNSPDGVVLPRSTSLRSASLRSDDRSSYCRDSEESGVTCNVATTITEISIADDLARRSHGLDLEAVTNVRGGDTLTPPIINQSEREAIEVGKKKQTSSACVVARLIVIMVCRNLIRNPALYASIAGLIWSLIAFRWNIATPKIVEGSVDILADAVTGMAMFDLGLSIALQPKIITCSKMEILIAMVVRFLVGPIVTAATSIVLGLHGPVLRVSIIQAALPQSVVTFVYAKVYGNQANILGTAVVFATLISLPVVLVYYMIIGL